VGEFDNDDGPVEGSKTSATTLPCAQCGAELSFHPGQARLKCEYCGHTQVIEFSADAAVIEYDLNDAITRYLGQVRHMEQSGQRQVKCEDCGADIIVAAGSTTARCDYCGGKRIIEEELPPEVLRPEALLPFKFDSANAVERFRKWLSGGDGFWGRLWVRLVRPSALQQRASVDDLHGIYVPFWTYDSNAHSNWTAQAGYYYYVTEHYTDSQGKRQSRQVRKIRWRWTSGSRRDHFDDWLVCASRQYYRGDLQSLMKQIEPFPTKALVPYDDKFLAGFRAEVYSLDLKAGWNIARDGMQAECYARCGRDVPGDTHRFLEVRTSYFGQSFKHVLLPVFVMGYRFKDKQYNVLINGSTGEVQGGAPLSWIKLLIIGIVLAALIGGGIAAYYLFGGAGQTSIPGGTPAVQSSATAPEPLYLPVHFKRNGNDEVWQLELSFAGANAAEKLKNWEEYKAQGLESKVEAEAERVIKSDRSSDYIKLAGRVKTALDQKFKQADGKPRFASVKLSQPRETRRK
jgi:DNA-directed RNA polymerase subunit RPC12/RpoP